MKVITDQHGILDDFALILEITDETLREVAIEPCNINKYDFMLKAVKENGNNCHVVQVTLNHEKDIMFKIEELLNKYNSVSWVRNDKFFIRRRSL